MTRRLHNFALTSAAALLLLVGLAAVALGVRGLMAHKHALRPV